jgi:hypothetical protein
VSEIRILQCQNDPSTGPKCHFQGFPESSVFDCRLEGNCVATRLWFVTDTDFVGDTPAYIAALVEVEEAKQSAAEYILQPSPATKYIVVNIIPSFLDPDTKWSDDFIYEAFKPFGTVEAYEIDDSLSNATKDWVWIAFSDVAGAKRAAEVGFRRIKEAAAVMLIQWPKHASQQRERRIYDSRVIVSNPVGKPLPS